MAPGLKACSKNYCRNSRLPCAAPNFLQKADVEAASAALPPNTLISDVYPHARSVSFITLTLLLSGDALSQNG